MDKLQVVKSFDYNPIHSWKICNPFVIFYVYPKDKTPFIIKGGMVDVEKWMDVYKTPCVYYRSLWFKGQKRGGWSDNISEVTKRKVNIVIYPERLKRTKTKTEYGGEYKTGKQIMTIFSSDNQQFFAGNNKTLLTKKIRRHPRSWIKELDAFLV